MSKEEEDEVDDDDNDDGIDPNEIRRRAFALLSQLGPDQDDDNTTWPISPMSVASTDDGGGDNDDIESEVGNHTATKLSSPSPSSSSSSSFDDSYDELEQLVSSVQELSFSLEIEEETHTSQNEHFSSSSRKLTAKQIMGVLIVVLMAYWFVYLWSSRHQRPKI